MRIIFFRKVKRNNMPITIGAKQESGFDDPIGLLGDCHRRIERFLSTLVAVADQARVGRLNHDQRIALETALRYFREAAPRHTADEEESLFPVLCRTGKLEPAILAKIVALKEDHEQATRYHHQTDRIGCRWLADGELQAGELDSLNIALTSLTNLYRGHIKVEDEVVFPRAVQALSDSEKAQLGCEMASRRGLHRSAS
jgi:hemerythrin-like domain-containing protein